MAKSKATAATTPRFKPEFSERTDIQLRSADVTPNPSYRYTTPSHLGRRAVKDRLKHGCIQEPRDRWCFKPEGKTASGKAKGDKCFHSEAEAVEAAAGKAVKYKPEPRFTGQKCRTKTKKGTECKDKTFDSYCFGSNSDPCGSPRATCPVQLIWIDGKPNLRFCKVQGEPGYTVPVSNVREAMEISNEACKDWPYKLGVVERADGSESDAGWDPEFFDRNAPQILEKARKSYPKREGLGQAPAASNPFWLLGGTALGLLAFRWMQRPSP